MWNYADAFYYNQGPENSGYVTTGFLREIGSDVPGLNVNRLLLDTYSPATRARFEGNAGICEVPRRRGDADLPRRTSGLASQLVVGSGKLESAGPIVHLAASGRNSGDRPER